MPGINMGETLWAWVTEESDGAISLVGVMTPGGIHLPLIGRSEKAVRRAEAIARTHGDALLQEPEEGLVE